MKSFFRIIGLIVSSWYEFLFVGVIAFFITFTSLGLLDMLPSSFQIAAAGGVDSYIQKKAIPAGQLEEMSGVLGEIPLRVIVPKIGVDAPILNPEVDTLEVLDAALLKGAVHYPGSGNIAEQKPMFLFGHSTSRLQPRSEVYKTFNRMAELRPGDEIQIEGVNKVAVYKVVFSGIYRDQDVLVDLTGKGSDLIMSTCNTFGKKEERIVVRAVLKEIIPLLPRR